MDVNQKVALVTGATSGIGNATCRRLATEGFYVFASGRNSSGFEELMADSRVGDGILEFVEADMADERSRRRLVEEVSKKAGRLDALVNCAGIIGNGSIESTPLDHWNMMLEINLTAVFQMMQLTSPLLEKTKGSMVNVSSVAGARAFPNVIAYCVSKAGVDQLTRCAALDLAPKGVRVNAVNPGVVVSNLHRRGGMSEERYSEFLEHSKTTHPLGRVGTPEEIADLIHFLVSDKASWITGVTYEIDGGRALTCAR